MVLTTRRSRIVLAVSTAVLAVSGVTAFAAIPNTSTGDIESCYQTKDGSLRVIDTQAGATCRKGETPLAWDQQGEPGPQGPAGPQGPVGPQGPAGTSGSTVFFAGGDVSQTIPSDFTGAIFVASVELPAGSYVAEANMTAVAGLFDPFSVSCFFADGDTVYGAGEAASRNEVVGDQARLSFTAAFNHDGGTLTLRCGAESFGDPQTVQLKFPTLLVHSVAAVNPAP